MGAGKLLWGYHPATKTWLPLQVDANGKVIVDMSAILEGNYTTWTIQAIYDTDVAFSGNDTLAVRNNGNILWHDQNVYSLYIISPDAVVLATIDGEMASAGYGRVASLLDKYILWREFDDGNLIAIAVQEGITKLWRRVVNDDRDVYTLDANPLYSAPIAISPSGEWIVAMVKEAVTGNGLIFIYRGS